MPDVIDSMLLMFVDDTKLYQTISSPIDHDILQEDIDRISAWGEQSLMSFNTDKCQVMTLGRSHEEYNCTMSKHGNSLLLNRCNEQQDLGILFTSNLKFSHHVSKIACKANRVIVIIKRSFHCIDKIMFCTLYVSLVRPHLEYASEIWNPHLIGDIQVLKKVQKHATKLVPDLRQLTYTDRLVALNLPSLLYR